MANHLTFNEKKAGSTPPGFTENALDALAQNMPLKHYGHATGSYPVDESSIPSKGSGEDYERS